MALFSERNNITPKKALQIGELDIATRNQIFNQIHQCYSGRYEMGSDFSIRFKSIYINHFKKPSTDRIISTDRILDIEDREEFEYIKKYIQKTDCSKVFDLIEYIFEIEDDIDYANCLKSNLNKIFIIENVGYRIINWEITTITNSVEIESMEESIDNSPKVVKTHLEKSLKFLSDKTKPDYKNSVKESISAVESMCKLILNNKNVTLGQALKEIEKNNDIEIPSALKNSFSKLYGYTSSEDGVRHASFDDKDLDYDLAKLLLVSCSAFTNYLLAKSKS